MTVCGCCGTEFEGKGFCGETCADKMMDFAMLYHGLPDGSETDRTSMARTVEIGQMELS